MSIDGTFRIWIIVILLCLCYHSWLCLIGGCGELIRKYKSCIILYFQSEARAFYDLIPAIIFSVSFCNHRACRDFLHLAGIGVWRCFVKISPVMLSVSGALAA